MSKLVTFSGSSAKRQNCRIQLYSINTKYYAFKMVISYEGKSIPY